MKVSFIQVIALVGNRGEGMVAVKSATEVGIVATAVVRVVVPLLDHLLLRRQQLRVPGRPPTAAAVAAGGMIRVLRLGRDRDQDPTPAHTRGAHLDRRPYTSALRKIGGGSVGKTSSFSRPTYLDLE